jgi:hypothetical protein
MTWRWIDEGVTFWPLMATVQEGGCEAVGATKSVEEMMAGEGIFIRRGDRTEQIDCGIWDLLDLKNPTHTVSHLYTYHVV